jgi:hypothetical protein
MSTQHRSSGGGGIWPIGGCGAPGIAGIGTLVGVPAAAESTGGGFSSSAASTCIPSSAGPAGSLLRLEWAILFLSCLGVTWQRWDGHESFRIFQQTSREASCKSFRSELDYLSVKNQKKVRARQTLRNTKPWTIRKEDTETQAKEVNLAKDL